MTIGKVKNISDYITLEANDLRQSFFINELKKVFPEDGVFEESEEANGNEGVFKYLKEYQKKEKMVKAVSVTVIFRKKSGVKKRFSSLITRGDVGIGIYSYLEQGKSLLKGFKTITQDSASSLKPKALIQLRRINPEYCYFTLSNCGGNEFKLSIKFKVIFTIGRIFKRRYLIEKDEDVFFKIGHLRFCYKEMKIKDNKWLTDNEIFDLFKDYIERDEFTHIERDENYLHWVFMLKGYKSNNDYLLEKDIPPKPKEGLQIYFNTIDPFIDGEDGLILQIRFENIINKISGSKTDWEAGNNLYIYDANPDKVYEALKPELAEHRDKFGGYKLWFSYKDPSKDKELEI